MERFWEARPQEVRKTHPDIHPQLLHTPLQTPLHSLGYGGGGQTSRRPFRVFPESSALDPDFYTDTKINVLALSEPLLSKPLGGVYLSQDPLWSGPAQHLQPDPHKTSIHAASPPPGW